MLMENYVWMFNKSLGPVAPRQSGLWPVMETLIGRQRRNGPEPAPC